MITKQKAATIAAIRDGAAQQHEGDGGRHDGHLGEAHALGRLLKHHGHKPWENDHLNPEAGEPGRDPAEVPAEHARLARLRHGRVRTALR